MKKESATIRKIAAAWDKKLWGFYDLQKPKTKTKENSMNKESNKSQAPTALYPAPLLGTRPPSRIGGKTNPAYQQWMKAKDPEKWRARNLKNALKWKRENPERWAVLHLRAQRKYEKTTLHERNVIVNKDECKCIACGTVFKKDDIFLRGFKTIKGNSHRIICDECA